MKIITLDFETFFSDDYTLKKMTTEAYIRDPRFEVHGASIRWPTTEETTWYTLPELRHVFNDIDWSETAVLAHHAQFDGLILSRHFKCEPKFWFDTLSMARLMLGNHFSVALASLAKHYGLAGKNVPYDTFKGKRWGELTPDVQKLVGYGCSHDVDLTWDIFRRLMATFPRSELELIDMTVRFFTEPKLIGDVNLLADVWREEETKKGALLSDLGYDISTEAGRQKAESDLQSSAKFAALLEAEGVEIVYKKGKNDNLIPAFGKNDDFMQELLDHDDDRVSGLAQARLGIKSTTLQTRAETLGYMATRGAMCVYLRYSGALTTRWAGGDSSNFQNLKRGHRIRRSLRAPYGYLLAAPDASQIECRLLNYSAGQWDVVERFRRGDDIYSALAGQFYGRTITKADTDERGTGKQGELSCGYGCGGPKFKRTAALGIYGPPVLLDGTTAQRFVDIYRDTHPAVVAYWRDAGVMLGHLYGGGTFQWGVSEIRDHRIWLPNGAPLIYDTLEYHHATQEELDKGYDAVGWRVKTNKGWQKMYGAKLVENYIQALARVHIGECMKTIAREGLRIVGMAHDEPWVLIPNAAFAQRDLQFCIDTIASSPPWLPDVPLAAEGKMSERYEK